jgi:YfiH family protein
MEMITEDTLLTNSGFKWRERDGLQVLVCDALERDGFTNGFSTRSGGVSPMPDHDLNLAGFADDAADNIHENRRRFLRLFDGQWTLSASWQVHGNGVRVVHDAIDAQSEEGRFDALTTNVSNILLGVKTADCVPVLIGDPKTGSAAAVHAGWRGTLEAVVQATLNRMKLEFGTSAADVRVAIGPAAAACCYEVGPDVVNAFLERFDESEHLFTPSREGRAMIDLQQANREQLISAGVVPTSIDVAPLCTLCRPDLFFSYRVEKHKYGRTGRLMSVIGRRADGNSGTRFEPA